MLHMVEHYIITNHILVVYHVQYYMFVTLKLPRAALPSLKPWDMS